MKNGFTLIELLTAIGILSILMGLGIPGFQTLSLNNQLDMRQSVLMQHLLIARSEAVERKRRVTICGVNNAAANNPVCVNDAWGVNGWVIFQDDRSGTIGAFNAAKGDIVLERFSVESPTVTFVTPTSIRRSITFQPDGTAIGGGSFTSATITLRDSRESSDCGEKTIGRRCLSITNTGRTRAL